MLGFFTAQPPFPQQVMQIKSLCPILILSVDYPPVHETI